MSKKALMVTAAVAAGLKAIAVVSFVIEGPWRALVMLSRPLAVLASVPIIWLVTR